MTTVRVKISTPHDKIERAYSALGLPIEIRQTITNEANAFSRSLRVGLSYRPTAVDHVTPEYIDEVVVRFADTVRRNRSLSKNRFTFSTLASARAFMNLHNSALQSVKGDALIKEFGGKGIEKLSAREVEAIVSLPNVGGQSIAYFVAIREICGQINDLAAPKVTKDFGTESCSLLQRTIARLPNPVFRKRLSSFLARQEKA
jgi:hypothetical protein